MRYAEQAQGPLRVTLNDERRRARKHAAFVEDIDRDTLFGRDEGICGICGQPVDPDDFHVDHDVPLSEGGLHCYANVQIAHPFCNQSKGAKCMKRRIFKYALQVESRQMLQMPRGAEVLSVGRQGPLPFLWASVDETQPPEARIFRSVTTGEWHETERLFYIGHVQLGGEKPSEAWYECFVYEVEQALDQINPDPIEERFQADLAEIRHEVDEVEARQVDDKGELIPPHRKVPA